MNLIRHTKHISVIENFWTPERCDEFILMSENMGYEPAMVQTERGQKVVKHVRNNQRILFKDFELAQNIWNDVKEHVNPELGKSKSRI